MYIHTYIYTHTHTHTHNTHTHNTRVVIICIGASVRVSYRNMSSLPVTVPPKDMSPSSLLPLDDNSSLGKDGP